MDSRSVEQIMQKDKYIGELRAENAALKAEVDELREDNLQRASLELNHEGMITTLKAKVERLKALLAASCVDERNLAISENPLVHGCDEAIKLEAEVERLRTLVCYGTDKERLEYKQSICKHSWQESGHGFKYCILCDQTIITKFFKSI